MARKSSQSLLTWLLWHPLKFALIAFGLIFLTTMILNIILPNVQSNWPVTLIVLISIICAMTITFLTMPRGNMKRHGFIALNNTQILITATAFLASFILISTYQSQITAQLIWLGATKKWLFFSTIVLIGLFYMYLCGVFFTNIYVKYQRCREMGISPWKIICSMPFGFGLLWTPGYLLTDDSKGTSSVTCQANWYIKLTNKILSKPIFTALAFLITTIYSGFFYGLKMVCLTLVCAIIFVLWSRLAGLSDFKQQQNRWYAYFAIAFNIVVFILLLLTTNPESSILTLSVSDVAPVNMK